MSSSGTDEKIVKFPIAELKKRFQADTGESTNYDSIAYSTFRTPTSRGLFGSPIDDKELLFAVQREPAAFKIVFGVAKDTLDNWFTVQLQEGEDDGSLNRAIQHKLDTLQAKSKLIRLLTLSRMFGYSLLILGYDDSAKDLTSPMEDTSAGIKYIEPYSKLEINYITEVKDAEDDRDGYPLLYRMKKSSGLSAEQIEIHYSRALLCSTMLVDHRYKGWSALQCLYDDVLGYRYMRWGVYMTMIRYGSGFPDVTLKGPEANQAAIDAFIASGQFDNLNGMKYFVHNETQELEFKGFQSSSLNPLNYYQIALETISLGSGIPEPQLKGAQAGALTGSEVNERNYFKVISDEQTAFEPILRQLLDSLLSCLPKTEGGSEMWSSEDEPLDYKIVWKPSYEPTQKEKAELDFINAQTAEKEGQFKTVDEVRKDRYKLLPLPNHAGEVVIGLQPKPVSPFGQSSLPQLEVKELPPEVLAQQQKLKAPTATPASKEKQQSPAQEKGADEAAPTEAPPEEIPLARTLPMLLKSLGASVMEGKLRKDEAFQRGKDLIVDYSRLEEEQALLWVKHQANFPGMVVISPEMKKKLDAERKRFLEDLDVMLTDCEKVWTAQKKV